MTETAPPDFDPGHETFTAAAGALSGIVHRTPVQTSASLSGLTEGQVWLKAENLQRTGSFKVRGAYLRMSRLGAEQRALGVVAASAGNHAQGVALAARELGIPATVFMPVGANVSKLEATRQYGADVVQAGGDLTEALAAAQDDAARTGRTLIHPYDHPDIVAGQGTIGLEILEQVPEVRTVVVPTGGGGLLAGVAAAVHAVDPDITVVGVQAAGAATYPRSLAAGRPIPLTSVDTMADGIAVGVPGQVPFSIIRRNALEVRTVNEGELSRAVLYLAERAKLVVEPSGAAGVAALLADPSAFPGRVAVLLSGGNVDPLVLLRIIRHGMSSSGRYLQLRVRCQDAPGSLAGLLHDLAAGGANVLGVEHRRTDAELAVDEVEIALELETRGPAHCESVLQMLDERGYCLVGSRASAPTER